MQSSVLFIATAVAVVAMTVFAVFAVMRTALGLGSHAAAQVGLDEFARQFVGLSGHHVDALFGKERKGSLADTPRNDNLNAEAVKPAWKRARLMFGGGQRFGMQDGSGVGVHFDDGEFTAAAEVGIEAVVFDRNGDFHYMVLVVYVIG